MAVKKKSEVQNNYNNCGIEATLDTIGNKWKGAILYYLLDGTKRFNELRRLMPKITQRMLTLQLRELEESEIITRTIYPEMPPRVEYSLTEFGMKLKPILLAMKEWGDHILKKKNSNY